MKKIAFVQTVVYDSQDIFEGIENDAKYIGRIRIFFPRILPDYSRSKFLVHITTAYVIFFAFLAYSK